MRNTAYCLVEDVLRRFDPTLQKEELNTNEFVVNTGLAQVEAAINSYTDEFEQDTGHAFRETRVGSPGAPETYETHGVDHEKHRRGVKVWLKHREVSPLDPSKGDVLQIRTGRRSWRDVTSEKDTRWNANYEKGWIRVHSGFRTPTRWNREIRDRNIRISYRYGALGGNRNRGGQTTTTEAITETDDSIVVENVSRLPSFGMVSLGGSEYIEYDNVDYDNNTLIGVDRGAENTQASEHDDGSVVHYVPSTVREAVANATAAEMLVYDDWVDRLIDADKSIDPREKKETWLQSFEREKARRAEAHIT